MNKFLCRIGFHSFQWGEIQSEEWTLRYNVGMSYYDPKKDDKKYPRHYIVGECTCCGIKKINYLD